MADHQAVKEITMPSGDFVANATFTRHGADLHLTSPDGKTMTVEGYFSHGTPPDIITGDGARLSPDMVDAFLPPEHAGQYAASGQVANDASPAGKITEIVGEAHVVRADGTRVDAKAGMPVFPGDVVETSAKGAVNLQFSDNTTFAISENARLSVDQYVYNSQEQSGSSFFSMLQGVFVYTSGLIGKSDPASVHIETPVGSIGIRGTVVAGQIAPAGQESKITIVDGAIVLSNGAGTMELNTGFATASMSSYQQAPVSAGTMSVAAFTQSYSAVAHVASDTFSHLDSFAQGAAAAHDAANANGHGEAPPSGADAPPPAPGDVHTQQAVPDGAQQAQPPAGQQPATPAGQQPPADVPQKTMMMDPAMQPVPPPPPPPSSTFGGLPGTANGPMPGTAAANGTAANGFKAGAAGDAATGAANAPPPSPPPAGTAANATNTTTTTTTTANNGTTAPPPVREVHFEFAPFYKSGTPTILADDGLPLFMRGVSAESNGMFLLGHVAGTNLPAGTTFSLAGPSGGSDAYHFGANVIRYNPGTTGNVYDTQMVPFNDAFYFDQATGALYLKYAGAALAGINSQVVFTLVASSPASGMVLQHNFAVVFKDQNIALPGDNIYIGDQDVVDANDPFSDSATGTPGANLINGTSANDLILGRHGSDTPGTPNILNGGGGRDTIIGGDNMINGDKIIVADANFHFVDGGAGTDKLVLGFTSTTARTFDFTTMPNAPSLTATPDGTHVAGVVRNIEGIELGRGTASVGNSMRLDIRDVFEMTSPDGNGDHTLSVFSSSVSGTTGSHIDVVSVAGSPFTVDSGTLGTGTVTLKGFYNSHAVTLIIEQDNSNGNHVAVNMV